MDDNKSWPEGIWAVVVGDPESDEHEIVPFRAYFNPEGTGVVGLEFGDRCYWVRPDDFFAALSLPAAAMGA